MRGLMDAGSEATRLLTFWMPLLCPTNVFCVTEILNEEVSHEPRQGHQAPVSFIFAASCFTYSIVYAARNLGCSSSLSNQEFFFKK